jgi:hypothetical protein
MNILEHMEQSRAQLQARAEGPEAQLKAENDLLPKENTQLDADQFWLDRCLLAAQQQTSCATSKLQHMGATSGTAAGCK